MAEMLVDGAKLDACNTAEADAIRAKTGGTDPIPYDYANNKGFADAIAAIPSGGGEKVYTKLAEVTVTEPVSVIDINLTEQMQSCECLYLVVDSIVFSEADWLYPRINKSSTGFGYTQKRSSLSGTIAFVPIKSSPGFVRRIVATDFSGYSVTNGANVNSVTSIGVNPYTSGVTITGGKLEVWGYV